MPIGGPDRTPIDTKALLLGLHMRLELIRRAAELLRSRMA
jgi:hypothetical protein